MFKKKLNLSKQLFISLSVALVLFVAGIAWAARWAADYWVAVKFYKISDRYNPSLGEVGSGNLYVKAYHYGNMINKVEGGEPDDITAKFKGGVAWFDSNQYPWPGTDIDMNNVDAAGGQNSSTYSDALPEPNDFVDPEFFDETVHFKQVDPGDVEDYWAGAYTITWFSRAGMSDSEQGKITTNRWAPNQTLNNVNYARMPSSGWGELRPSD